MFASGDIDPSRRGPGDDFWYYPIGTPSAAGIRVSPQTALAVSTLFACCMVLAQDVAQVPVHLYRRLDPRGKERATDHPLYRLINRKPNRWQTSFQWFQMMQWHLVLRYNAYSRILYDARGMPVELIPLNPDRVRVERIQTSDGIPNFRYRFTPEIGDDIILTRGEVFHVRGLTNDGVEGLSMLDAQKDSIGEAIAAQSYGSRRMKNDARPQGVIEWSAHFGTDDDRRKFRSSFQEAQTGANAGKVAVLERGMTWKDLGVKNTDLQYIELRKMKREDIAAAFRMQPHKVGIMDAATFSNIEQQAIEHLQDTMMPHFRNWETALSDQLLTEDEQDEYFFEFLHNWLLRGDVKARGEYIAKRFAVGSLSPNDIRELENENPIEGGDRYFVQVNLMPLDRVDDVVDKGQQQPASAPADQAAADAANAERVVRIETAAFMRAHKRVDLAEFGAAFYASHAGTVAEVMGCDAMTAVAYCAERAVQLEQAVAAGRVVPWIAGLEASGAEQLLETVRAARQVQEA